MIVIHNIAPKINGTDRSNATQKYPQDIHQYIKATARAVSTYFFTERPKASPASSRFAYQTEYQ